MCIPRHRKIRNSPTNVPFLITSSTSEHCQSAGAQTLHPTRAGGTQGAGEEFTQPPGEEEDEEDAPRKAALLKALQS